MKTQLTIICLITLVQISCTTTHTSDRAITSTKPALSLEEKDAWRLLTGKWYGSQPTAGGGKREEIVERRRDGTQIIRFRTHDLTYGIKDDIEVGQWGISGPVYFTFYRGSVEGDYFSPSDPSNPSNYDAYHILNLTEERFEYEHVVTGNRFVLKKVPSYFEFTTTEKH